RPMITARELTKVHQEVLRGTSSEIMAKLKQPRGEFTIVLGPTINMFESGVCSLEPISATDLAHEFLQLTESGAVSRREAITQLSKRHRRSAREVYSLIEGAKNSVE